MKRVNIILVALSLLLVGQLWAQQDRRWHSMSEQPRRAWATFEGDTARYLEFNYTIRSRQYIGWTVGELLDELELPVIGIVSVTRAGLPSELVSLTFGIQKKTPPYHRALRDYYIVVRFEDPPLLEGFWIGEEEGLPITQRVRDLIISEVSANPYIQRDSELVERRRREDEEFSRWAQETREFLDRLDRAESEEERERLIDEDRPRIETRLAAERLRQAEWDAERRQLIEQQRQRREREREENQRRGQNRNR